MRNNYEVRAQKFIQQIFPYLEGCENNHDEREYAILAFNHDYNRKVMYKHGMTRYALITADYAVKVDYACTRWGNSEDEMKLYEEAVQDGFEYMFAKITRYTYLGINFYIMPRVYGIGKKFDDADWYMSEDEKDWCYDHNLCDLHKYNYGWKDDHVVIFDYAARY